MECTGAVKGLVQYSALSMASAVQAFCFCMALTSFPCHAELQESVLAELPQIVKGAALKAKKQAILYRISGDDEGVSPLLGSADFNSIANLLLKPEDPAAVRAVQVLQQLPELFEDGSTIKQFIMSFKGMFISDHPV